MIYLFSTYHMFFDRLALSDTVSNAAVALGLYFAFRLSCRIDEKDALLSGFALFVAVGAKIGALPYMGIPLAAALTLGPRTYGWARRGRWLTVSTVAMLSPLAILYVVGRWRNQNIFMHIQSSSSTGNQVMDLDRIQQNIEGMLRLTESYFGLVALALLVIGALWLLIRRRLFLPLVFSHRHWLSCLVCDRVHAISWHHSPCCCYAAQWHLLFWSAPPALSGKA
jgi:hypothetical protein